MSGRKREVLKRGETLIPYGHTKKLHKGKKILPEIDLEAVCEAYENILPEFLHSRQLLYLKNFRNRFYAYSQKSNLVTCPICHISAECNQILKCN